MEDIIITKTNQYPILRTSGNNHLSIHIDLTKKRLYKLYGHPCGESSRIISALYEKQRKIKHTQFPIGRVLDTTKTYCLGSVQVYFENYQCFKNIYNEELQTKLKQLKTLLNTLEELHQNGVYQLDLHNLNILYKEEDIQIIDWDNSHIRVTETMNRTSEIREMMSYEGILLETLLKNMDYKSNEELRKILFEKNPWIQKIYEKYICNQYSFNGYNHFFEELSKKEKELKL